MRIFTRQDEPPVTEHAYVCAWGTGKLLLAGDLPLELDLPVPASAAGAGTSDEAAARGARAGVTPLTAGQARETATSPAAAHWARLLARYFDGDPVNFELDVAAYGRACGLSAFELAVFSALAQVPWGTAVSYRELAAASGHPNAYRAAGSVMARNRLPVILPCHRVVRNDGRLGQYGDDPAWKGRLLTLEGVTVREGRLA